MTTSELCSCGWRLPQRRGVSFAIPLEFGPRRQRYDVVGRAEPFTPDDVGFAR